MNNYRIQFKYLFFAIILLLGSAQVSNGQPPQITHGPFVQFLTSHKVVINFSSSTDCISWVEFYKEDGSNFYQKERERIYSSTGGLKNIGKLHHVIIDDLNPSTKYAYRIYCQEYLPNGNLGKTIATQVFKKKPLSFTTLSPEKEQISCIVLSDMHEGSAKTGNLLSQFNLNEADFLLLNGDFVNNFNTEEAIYSVIDTCVDVYAKEKPLYIVRGNHETRGSKASLMNQYFYFPENQYYYTFSIGSTFFIVLDSGEDKPDSDIEYNGLADFDSYRSKEAAWLKKVVESEEYKTSKHKIVFMHIPPYDNKRGKEWHGVLDVRNKFTPILNKADVDLMLCGHTHSYSFNKATAGENNFPIAISDNNSVTQLLIDNSGIKLKMINTNSKVVSELSFKK
jgi:predicted phosphodiesterase